MMRITSKHFVNVARIAALLVACSIPVFAAAQSGTAIGAGVGNQVHAFAFDPQNQDVAYAGGDVCGVYKFTNSATGGSWEPWSEGLGFDDLNMSFYVDDLLVVRNGAPPAYQGVYAATHGGIYFRKFDAPAWSLLTGNLTYSGGYAHRKFFDGTLRIPFSSLAFDKDHSVLYAGAGHGRTDDDARQLAERAFGDFYPTTDGIPHRNAGQYSLWSCDLGSSQVFGHVPNSDHGKVRQVAVMHYENPTTTKILYASDDGVVSCLPGGEETTVLIAAGDKTGVWLNNSGDAWGVGAGADGWAYALMCRANATRPPGLWKANLRGTTRVWEPVDSTTTVATGETEDRLWAGTESATWSGFKNTTNSDLSELTVIPGAVDEIFAGEGRNGDGYGMAGYFRYGQYNDNGVDKIGWAHIHRTNYGPNQGATVYVADWRHGPIHDSPLEAPEVGWLSWYQSLTALTPFAVHPQNPAIMAGIDLGIPLMTRDGGDTWKNLYCKAGTGGGWTNRGLNLMCAVASTFLPDGRLAIAGLDFGVFLSVPGDLASFVNLHASTTDIAPAFPSAIDVEAVTDGTTTELYMVDDVDNWTNGQMFDRVWMWAVDSATSWDDISESLADSIENLNHGAPIQIEIKDIALLNSDTLFASVGARWENSLYGEPHYYIYRATRGGGPGNWVWQWTKVVDADAIAGANGTKVINRICLLPSSSELLFGAKYKYVAGPSLGGLYEYNYATGAVSDILVGGAASDLEKLAENITAITADPLGRYVYIGSSGHDRPDTPGRGGVVRLTPGESGWSPEILAGKDGLSEDVFGVGPVTNFTWTSGPSAWEFCTRVADIEVDPHNPRVIYAAVGNGSYFGAGFGAWRFNGTTWTHECIVEEAGSGGATVALAPTRDKIYLGTTAQEFFVADVDAPDYPAIATSAAGPMWSTGHATPTTIAVSITHPGNLGMTVELYPAALDVTGPSKVMYDGGPDVAPGTDLIANDHIYTSESFNTNVAAGTYQVRVFAQATDGSYNEGMVIVEAVSYAAKFTNVSNEPLGISYSGTPYSAIALDYDGGEKDFLLTQGDANAAMLFQGQLAASGGVPRYVAEVVHASAIWRGAAAADFDNDGHTDYFIAGENSVLWHNEASTGVTGDVTSALGLVGVDHATAACWGDYDHDGWLDLFVVRNVLDGVSPGVLGLVGDHRLFRNCIGEGGGFVDVTATAGLNAITPPAAVSASWVDVDQDGNLDLFVAMAPLVYESGPPAANYSQPFPTPSRLFMNQGNGTFVDGFDARFAEQLSDITASVWADVNGDLAPDLLLGMGSNGARAFLNDGTGHFDAAVVQLRDGSAGYSGLAVADQDLDGWQDILLAPSIEGRSVQLLLNKEQFGSRRFADATAASGLGGQVPVSGLLAADFTGDGDMELFAGMPFGVKNFFYKSDAQDGTARLNAHYAKVRLASPYGANCRDGTGARVVVMETTGGAIGFTQLQVVDGGSGRGSQRDRDLVFGLGDYDGTVTASVFWPNGHVQTNVALEVSDCRYGESLNVVTDNSTPTISNVSATSVIDLSNNTLTWTFSWDTNVSSYWQTDEVQFLAGTGAYCPPGGPSVMATDDNASHTYVALGNGVFRHSLTIANFDCIGNCTFRYRVRSGDGPNKSYSPWYVKTVRFCPSQF